MPKLFQGFEQRFRLLIDVNFGNFRGLVRLLLAELEYLSGRLKSFTTAHPADVKRLVFVCLGNINRSAFAAEVARVSGARAISIGLSTTTGALAFEKAISTSRLLGFDLATHRATNFNDYKYLPGDLLLAMEVRHARDLVRRGIPVQAIALLGHWGAPHRIHIHDPHILSERYFQTCFIILYSATHRLVTDLLASNAPCIE